MVKNTLFRFAAAGVAALETIFMLGAAGCAPKTTRTADPASAAVSTLDSLPAESGSSAAVSSGAASSKSAVSSAVSSATSAASAADAKKLRAAAAPKNAVRRIPSRSSIKAGGVKTERPTAQSPSPKAAVPGSGGYSVALKKSDYTPLSFSEVKGVWVVTAWQGDFPKSSGVIKQKKEMSAMLDTIKSDGLNTVFFQVRPMADAFYRSSIYPWSEYLTGRQGQNPGYDPLAYFISEAHKRGIAVQAWINPFRVCEASDYASRASNSPAVLHKDWMVRYTDTDSKKDFYWFNPGLPQVRGMIVAGVEEIAENYNVDGIHFDDYFYPYDCNYYESSSSAGIIRFDDSAAYRAYGAGKSLADWRRANVDALVQQTYQAVKAVDSKMPFGISPFGIWATKSVSADGAATTGASSYSEIYADSKLWVEKHWVDYICPQIYWGFDTRFAVMADWWGALCGKNNVSLYIGINSSIAAGGAGKWTNSQNVNEVNYARKEPAYNGSVFFSYSGLSSIKPILCGLH